MREDYTFRGQRDDEEIIFMINQNPWIMAKGGFYILILAIIVVISLYIFGASGVTSLIVFVFLIIGGMIAIFNWFIWWNGRYILTDQRIIKIDQKSIFYRKISEAELDRIQDITSEIKGPIFTALNVGVIHIQTASASAVIDLNNVTDPYEIQQTIVKAHKIAKNELPGQIEIKDNFEPIIR